MVYKQQVVALATTTFTEKLLVESAEFTYNESEVVYKSLCGPHETQAITIDEDVTCKITAGTSSNLHNLYVAGFGASILSDTFNVLLAAGDLLQVNKPIEAGSIIELSNGTSTAICYVSESTLDSILVTPSLSFTPTSGTVRPGYKTSSNTVNLIKVLEQFPEQSYEHLNMSCDELEIFYSLTEMITTKAILRGSEKATTTSIPDVDISVLPKPASRCKIRVQGMPSAIRDLTLNITNTFEEYKCMSGETIGKILVDKEVSGSFTIEGALKDFTSGYLMVSEESLLFIPKIKVTELKELFDSDGVYTKVSFNAVNAETTLAF